LDRVNFLTTAQKTTAKVVQLAETITDDGFSSYAPIFEFKDKNGTLYTVRSNVSSSPSFFEINESIEVLYDPKSPQKAQIDSFFQ
jgi:hypothetical protein